MKQYRRYRTQGCLSPIYPNKVKTNQKRKLSLKPLSIWGWFVKTDG